MSKLKQERKKSKLTAEVVIPYITAATLALKTVIPLKGAPISTLMKSIILTIYTVIIILTFRVTESAVNTIKRKIRQTK